MDKGLEILGWIGGGRRDVDLSFFNLLANVELSGENVECVHSAMQRVIARRSSELTAIANEILSEINSALVDGKNAGGRVLSFTVSTGSVGN